MMLVEGKGAVVTGSSRGLGRAFALGLAEEGARLVVNGTSAEDVNKVVEEIKTLGGAAVGCVESVASMTGAQRIIQCALDHFGRLDILVNNAGVVRDRMIWNMTEEEWDTVIDVHLKGTFACTQAAVAVMRPQQSGSIINITSGAALRGNMGQSNYAAAKAGIIAFTICCALELARNNVRVNVVRPRARTQMTEAVMDLSLKKARDAAQRNNVPAPSYLDLGFSDPKLVAPLVVFLASEEAKDITGQIVSLSGNKLSLFTHYQEVKTVILPEGWNLEQVRKHFRMTFALDLERTRLQPGAGSFI
jgi:NAD(P)-dependent dehydrogenase (short-subunit alcohol dehydrogenase family)